MKYKVISKIPLYKYFYNESIVDFILGKDTLDDAYNKITNFLSQEIERNIKVFNYLKEEFDEQEN